MEMAYFVKEFLLIVLFSSNTAVNSSSMIDGFKSIATCEASGERIIASIDEKFVPASAGFSAKYKCIEIVK